MNHSAKKPDADEILFTLDQLEQTTEIMGRVVARLKRQLMQIQQSNTPCVAAETTQPQPATSHKPGKTLH